MTNHTNVYLINSEKLINARASEMTIKGRRYLREPSGDVTVLQWIEQEFARAERPSFVQRFLWNLESKLAYQASASRRLEHMRMEVESLLLYDYIVPSGLRGAATFHTDHHLSHDLQLISAMLQSPVRERILESLWPETTRFPPSVPNDSPLRILQYYGWAFLDREETDEVLRVIKLLRARDENPEGDERISSPDYEWDELVQEWEKGDYDLTLLWWL